jgi:hypothetical protein
MSKEKVIVSYGQTEDEYVEIESLSDEIRFEMCMKLYKTHLTVKELTNSITKKGLNKIKDII